MEKYKASNWSEFSTSAVYTLEPGVIGHIISVRKNNADYFYHYDPIGNVMFITDNVSNKAVEYMQEGFGNVLASIGSAQNNYHLTTKEQEPETGLYYFYARWYDPQVGRFITWDPILRRDATLERCGIVESLMPRFFRDAQDLNAYIYAYNSPINLTDPYGLHNTCYDYEKACLEALKKCLWEAGETYASCVAVCSVTSIGCGPFYFKCFGARLLECTAMWSVLVLFCEAEYKRCLEQCK